MLTYVSIDNRSQSSSCAHESVHLVYEFLTEFVLSSHLGQFDATRVFSLSWTFWTCLGDAGKSDVRPRSFLGGGTCRTSFGLVKRNFSTGQCYQPSYQFGRRTSATTASLFPGTGTVAEGCVTFATETLPNGHPAGSTSTMFRFVRSPFHSIILTHEIFFCILHTRIPPQLVDHPTNFHIIYIIIKDNGICLQ